MPHFFSEGKLRCCTLFQKPKCSKVQIYKCIQKKEIIVYISYCILFSARIHINNNQKQKEAKESFIKEINFQASDLVSNLIDEMLNEINMSIHNSFKVILNDIQEKKRKVDEQNKITISKKDNIENIIDSLSDISKNLKIDLI